MASSGASLVAKRKIRKESNNSVKAISYIKAGRLFLTNGPLCFLFSPESLILRRVSPYSPQSLPKGTLRHKKALRSFPSELENQ
jgi:hypothetical protein